MKNLQFKSITEQRLGWLHSWQVEKSDLIKLLKNYPFILTEGSSEYLDKINYLKTFQELKELVARRIDELNEFIDDEFFSNKEIFNEYKKDAESVENIEQLRDVLSFLELETSFKLTLNLNILNDPYIYYNKLNIVTWKNGGAQYDFTVELEEVI